MSISRVLIVAGIALVILGLARPWMDRVGLGRLPGDLVIERGSFRLYIPITTCILVSAALSLALWLLGRR